jgi:hypothetical protein
MKKIFYSILLFIAISNVAIAQDILENPISFGISGGIDYNFNAYKTVLDTSVNHHITDYYGIKPHYNIGANVGLMLNNKMRIRAELKFVKMSYKQNWNPDYYTDFDNTVTRLYNFDINVYFDYLLLNKGKFEIFVSPGLKSEYVLKHSFWTESANSKSAKFQGLENMFPSTLAGGALTGIIKYNVSKTFGLTLTPDYTLFFRKFSVQNSGLYTRFSINAGMEFRF